MPANDYHFITTWRLPASREEIAEILGDAPALARWWPSVYLDVQELEPGDASGIGRVVALYTKGFLPYTLRWRFTVTESNLPDGFALDATGDFVGRGIWTFRQDGAEAVATYDWRILAEKGILKTLSPIMKPIFAANHRWAMARGEESIRLELARRRATTLDARMRLPRPPGPTFPHNLNRRLRSRSASGPQA